MSNEAHTPPPENGLTVERVRLVRDAYAVPPQMAFSRDIVALCDAWLAAQEPKGDGWRPIETAPRDGRIIIGWSAGWESPTAIQWVDGYEWRDELGDERREIADWDWNGTIQCPPSHDPTHWRPLPAPPNTREGEG